MRAFRFLSFIFIIALAATFVIHAQGPKTSGSETVAKPKKKGDTSEPDQAKIPSKFPKKDSDKLPDGVPVFSADATTVTVDVAVIDNKNPFIPRICQGKVRIPANNVPRKVI